MNVLAQVQNPFNFPTPTTNDTSTFHLPHVEYSVLLPELIVIGGALLLLLLSAVIVRRRLTTLYTTLTVITLGAAAVPLWFRWDEYSDHAAHPNLPGPTPRRRVPHRADRRRLVATRRPSPRP
jgi:hypothetical protein